MWRALFVKLAENSVNSVIRRCQTIIDDTTTLNIVLKHLDNMEKTINIHRLFIINCAASRKFSYLAN